MNPIVPIAPVVVAFYKGTRPGLKGKLITTIGRALDHGPYTHTEIILNNNLSYSSSLEDKGVRGKYIGYSTKGAWDFLVVPKGWLYVEQIERWFREHDGDEYDILGNLRFFTNFITHSPHKWFCSETTMEVFNFPESFRYGPNGAAITLQHHFKTRMIIT